MIIWHVVFEVNDFAVNEIPGGGFGGTMSDVPVLSRLMKLVVEEFAIVLYASVEFAIQDLPDVVRMMLQAFVESDQEGPTGVAFQH